MWKIFVPFSVVGNEGEKESMGGKGKALLKKGLPLPPRPHPHLQNFLIGGREVEKCAGAPAGAGTRSPPDRGIPGELDGTAQAKPRARRNAGHVRGRANPATSEARQGAGESGRSRGKSTEAGTNPATPESSGQSRGNAGKPGPFGKAAKRIRGGPGLVPACRGNYFPRRVQGRSPWCSDLSPFLSS